MTPSVPCRRRLDKRGYGTGEGRPEGPEVAFEIARAVTAESVTVVVRLALHVGARRPLLGVVGVGTVDQHVDPTLADIHPATLDCTFFVLSDPTRRSILERLVSGPATIIELAEPFGLTLNGVKKHVHVLENADLVMSENVGRARECRLGPRGFRTRRIGSTCTGGVWEQRLDRFEDYVEKPGRTRFGQRSQR